jgi:type II secretion system protein G
MKTKAFTLIELLVVVSIIALLAGITIPAIIKANLRAREAMAKAEIATLHDALTMYDADYGCYPQEAADNSSKALVDALKGDATADPPKPTYYQFKKTRLTDGEFYSPLNKAYYYRENDSEKTKTDEMHNPDSYDIWTENGKEEKEGINNW